jgi:hypothetical protein
MLKASWRSFSRILIVAAAVVYPQSSAASGGGYCDDVYCKSFFMPETIRSPLEAPFFLSNMSLYEYKDEASQLQDMNLSEWSLYFGGAIPSSELSSLLYKMAAEDVAALSASLSGATGNLAEPARTLRAAFLKYGRKERVVRALEYLVLAKRVEPIATNPPASGWDDKQPEPIDAGAVRDLLNGAERQLRGADKFLAQRYRFQTLRLLFYSGQYPDAQRYFEQNRAAFTEENSPKYRSMSIAAGAYYKDKKFGQANYLFSLVFDKFPPLKASSYFSFHPMEDADWRQTLSLAKNQREKEVLWQLLGIYADGLDAIDQIYRLNPRSNLLPLLLVREVNRIESDWSSNKDLVENGSTRRQPRPDEDVVGPKRLAKLKAIADAGNTYTPYLWRLSVAHLFALAGDRATAERYLDASVAGARGNPEAERQVRMSRLLARVNAMKAVDRSAEPYFAEEFRWFDEYLRSIKPGMPFYEDRARHVVQWALEQLSRLYLNAGDPVRAALLKDDRESAIYRSVAGIDAVFAFTRTASTPFDKWLVSNYEYSTEQLHELRALSFLYSGDLTNALAEFKQSGARAAEPLAADPFTIQIRECWDCYAQAPHTTYTKQSFLERMILLSRSAQGQSELAAKASFELATGFMNMTFYGNSRQMFWTPHSNLFDWRKVANVDPAEKYFLQAFNKSTDRELKTKALFMAAKAEQNRYYETRKLDTELQPHVHFGTLRASFSDTRYYQEIIRECGRFRRFLQQ